MRIFFRRILIFVLVAALFFTNINISVAASGIGKESFYQMKNEQEDTRQIENITTESQENTTAISKETTEEKEKSEQGTTEQHNEAEEKSTEQESESAGTQDKSQQQQEKLTGSELKEGGQTKKSTERNQEQSTAEQREDEEEESVPVVMSTHPSTNHSVTMPDVTSHYFLLQKNSKKVGSVTGKNLLTVANAQAASKYIYESYSNGRQYNFTPRFNNNSSVSVGGGTGGEVSFTKVKNGTESEFGTLYPAVSKGRIASKVFNLQKTTVNAEIPVTELMQDEDYINIPGTPLAKIAKLADKTQGVTLVKGRYEGQKEEGIYEYGDTVDYTITLTNAGTADLYNLLVDDTLDKKLLSILKSDSITITTGQVTTKMGDTIQVRTAEKDEDIGKDSESITKQLESRSVVLDHLKSGDSVAIHLKGIIQSGANRDTGLNNMVHLVAQYKTVNENGENEENYVEDTPEMTDNDTVGIGTPDILAAKKADKTKNVILENGRYTGKKKYGTYKAGEEVQFILTVTNVGNGTANHVKVTEEPSAELKKYVQMKGFVNKAGDVIRTKKGKELHIETSKKRELCLEKIEAEDAVELIYIGKVKKDIPSIKFLKNEVVITGQNKDGSKIPTTSKMSDYDKINLKEKEIKNQNPKKNRETGTKGNGAKTGDNTPVFMYSFLSIAAILALSVLISYKNKKRKN